jgi:hypothetical protein
MKKLYVLAALLMASTAAHAGNSIAFEINGNGVRVEVPKNCDSLSCLRISAPGLSGSGIGFKDKSDRFDDDDVAVRPDPPAPKTAPAPVVQAATRNPPRPTMRHPLPPRLHPPRPRQQSPRMHRQLPLLPRSRPLRQRRPLSPRRRPRRSECGPPKRTIEMSGSSRADPICADMP